MPAFARPSPLQVARRPRRSLRAFTLVELLAAIAVLGVLAFLLIPAVGTGIEMSRGANCASNMRQITQAILMYATDHDGMAPPGNNVKQYEAAGGVPGSTGFSSTYFYSVWPYFYGPPQKTYRSPQNVVTLNSLTRNVFHCPTRYARYPSAELAPPEMFVSGKKSSFTWWDYYSYAINAMAAPGENINQWARALNSVRVRGMKYPSRTVAIVEDYNWYATFDKYYDKYGVLPHSGKANFAFYDGHVERLGRSQIPTKAEAPKTVFWSGDNVE